MIRVLRRYLSKTKHKFVRYVLSRDFVGLNADIFGRFLALDKSKLEFEGESQSGMERCCSDPFQAESRTAVLCSQVS